FFYLSVLHCFLYSFPTRRSSDLPFAIAVALFMTEYSSKKGARFLQSVIELLVGIPSVVYGFLGLTVIVPFIRNIFGGTEFGILRSEEHTSELQSRFDLVCRLLLE